MPWVEVAERFWAKVDRRGPDECWPWTGAVQSRGYGIFRVDPETLVLAHRLAYELAVGPIADGLDIDHVHDRGCTTTLCCNWGHLEPVTNAENHRRGAHARKTHCPKGHPYAGENLRVDKRGSRHCRTCQRESNAARIR
jgi:hypothetical protein